MQALTALLVLALDAAGANAAPPSDLGVAALLAVASRPASPPGVATPRPASGDGGAPAPPTCLGEVCQPQVAVPGYEPGYSTRGLRTQLTLQALDALRLEPVATVAWWLASTGVRLDYTPAAVDAAMNGGAGVSHLEFSVRWRIDAYGSPVWLKRQR